MSTSGAEITPASDASPLVIGPESFKSISRRDLIDGLQRWDVWILFGWLDIRQRYRRSKIGPFWLTISMGITVVTLGLLYSFLFKVETSVLIPWLTTGFILWGYVSQSIGDSCLCFISAEGYIKNVQMPLSVHLLRVLWRNTAMMAHNLVILPFVYLYYGHPISIELLYVIPGFCLLVANLFWVGLVLGILCTRFRDLPQIILSILQIAFYLTPIIWTPALLPDHWRKLITFNPFFSYLDIVRAPLLGTEPHLASWLVSLALLAVGGGVTLVLYGKFHRRIPYWI